MSQKIIDRSQFMNWVFRPTQIALMAAVLFSGSAERVQAEVRNVLGNPGFEDAIGGSYNWDNTTNRGLSRVTGGAPSGSAFLRLDEATTVLGSAGVFTFQTAVVAAKPGDTVSFSGLVRVNALDGGDAAQLRIEYQTAAGTTLSDTIAAVSAVTAGFSRVVAKGTAPAGTAQVTFTLRIQPSNVGGGSQADFDEMEGTISSAPLSLTISPVSASVKPGESAPIAVAVENTTAETMFNVELVADPPPGINIHSEVATFNGAKVPQRQGSVIFSLGNLTRGQSNNFVFFITLTSAVVPGKSYELRLYGRDSTGNVSENFTIFIKAQNDPVFDEGTIIGKVFDDKNGNTIQDRGEKGVPWVRLITEEGIIIVTDKDGKYHLPAVKPGRHVIKIDHHTLPKGTEFISEEALLVKTTPGIMNKANFAVRIPPSAVPAEFREELNVTITQGVDTTVPKLQVSMEPHILRTGVGVLEKEAVFKFDMNYQEFVKHWYLEVRDELGQEVWTGFGVGAPPKEVVWGGMTEQGLLVKPGLYSYRLKVEDKEGNQDWSLLKYFRVVSKGDASADNAVVGEIPSVGDFNIFRDGKQTISLVAKPTLQIHGQTKPGYQVTVNNFPVDVHPETGVFQTEMYVSPGEKNVVVTASNPEGENVTYQEKVAVKDSTFFMVGLGEEQLGYNFVNGSVESFGNKDQFQDRFYEDGRLSYYLRGKIKGKFLIKSHYDTSEPSPGLFTNLDPDQYYPVYGDASTRDYEAKDSQQKFFFVIEMDRSYAKWGSYKTEFNDTELASYNRTLSGLKVNVETQKTTPYGDPTRGFKVFWSQSRHKADHNEFAATGGSLYYLRHRDVIEGSEKIRVEVRDKIQNMTIESRDLTEGKDYEIDYSDGRILLSRPLSSVAASDTLFSTDILDGNPVFLVVDYEYDIGPNAIEDGNRGLRGYTHVGDHVKIGATAVEENRGFRDYDLRGTDMTVKLGRNTKVTAEYATSIDRQTEQALSYNGGLSFAALDTLIKGTNTRPRENAYLIRGESQPIKKLETSGYVQGVEPSFSNDHLRSQEGTKKYGLASRYKFTEAFSLRYRFDSNEISDQLLPFTEHNIYAPYEDYQTHTAQALYDDRKWLGEAEYIRQNVNLPVDQLRPSLLSAAPFDNGMALKLGRYLNERLLPYVKFQSAFDDGNGHRYGGGVRYEVLNKLYAYVEEMGGSLGDSTLFGIERQHEGGAKTYANFETFDRGFGPKTLSTTVGSSYSLTEKSRFYSEKRHASYQGIDGFADILGISGRPSDRWDFDARFERRHLDNSFTTLLDGLAADSLARTSSFNTISTSAGYAINDQTRVRSAFEIRIDDDSPEVLQILTRNSIERKINQDLSLLGKIDYGRSRFIAPDDTPADFLELNTGFAYRPVDFDKLNILGRYTYLRDLGSDYQFTQTPYLGVEIDEISHIFSIDVAYDWSRYVGFVEKLAYKTAVADTSLSDSLTVNSLLSIHRANIHVTKKWDLALEYRLLWQADAIETLKHGTLVEVDRELYDYVRIGAGYNFTDFDDDLRKSSGYDSHGPFVRMTGKF